MDDALTRLAESRREFERRLEETRQAVRSEVGAVRLRGRWLVPALAAAAGLALAGLVARRRFGRRAARRLPGRDEREL